MPLPALADLGALAGQLRESGADLKVVREDQFHLTLKFFGEVPQAQVAPLASALREARLPAKFPLILRDVGAFPNWRKLNVFWVGVQDPTGGFGHAFTEVEHAYARFGFDPEGRAFRPHLTLARKRSERGLDRARAVLETWRGREFGPVTIDRVRLYKSNLTPEGPVYDVVEEVALT